MKHAPVIVALLLAILIAACSDTPIDPDSALVTTRQPDTLRVFDTLLLRPDTVTIWQDSIVVRYDTVFTERIVTVINHDTITVTRTDTVTIRDTVTVSDRSYLRWGEVSFTRFPGASIPIEIDTKSTSMTVQLNREVPTAISLRLMARVPEVTDSAGVYKSPRWVHLNIVYLPTNGPRVLALRSDPINNPDRDGIGILYHPYDHDLYQWLATGNGNDGTFSVTKIDPQKRIVYATVNAGFWNPSSIPGSPPSVTIDQLELQLGY